MPVEKRKSERKTLFVSFLDADANEVSELQQDLMDCGLTDEYRVILSAKPVQALNDSEMEQLVKVWLEYSDGTNDDMYKLKYAMKWLVKSMEAIKSHIAITDENFMHIEGAFRVMESQINNQVHVQPGFNRLMNDSYVEVNTAYGNLIQYIPTQEGVKL